MLMTMFGSNSDEEEEEEEKKQNKVTTFCIKFSPLQSNRRTERLSLHYTRIDGQNGFLSTTVESKIMAEGVLPAAKVPRSSNVDIEQGKDMVS